MKRVVLTIIHWYQMLNCALLAQRFPLFSWTGCRQVPTCSTYCAQQVTERGVLAGLSRGLIRFLRCNPLVRVVYG